MTRRTRWLAVGLTAAALAVGPAAAASAHPLGNFTVNHYDGLIITPSQVSDLAVVDTAEIPTAQQRPAIDSNHDGTVSDAERTTWAASECTHVADAVHLTIDTTPATWRLGASSFVYRPGAAGLHTSRLTCTLTAATHIARRTTITISDNYDADRIGWHEITADGRGVHLDHAPVPQHSVSDELLHYPNALLTSPLDVRTAAITVLPGPGVSTVASTIAAVPGAGPLARGLDHLNRIFDNLVGAAHPGIGVGLLAVLLSLLLGASHAALPGHGKTVMAAYIAGRRGSKRDALVVGATVTVTHTAGVLILGLALTLSASLAGDRITTDLGLVSGLLLAIVGVGLLRTAILERRRRAPGFEGDADRTHTPDHHGADHHHHPHDNQPGPTHGHRRLSRAGLVGMGVAGGLVPSPSALVVLLGAIALGRTVFGVLLVLGYGVGMAATLTAAGLLLVRLRDRLERRSAHRHFNLANRLSRAMPLVTASLVIVVGLSLTARGALPVL